LKVVGIVFNSRGEQEKDNDKVATLVELEREAQEQNDKVEVDLKIESEVEHLRGAVSEDASCNQCHGVSKDFKLDLSAEELMRHKLIEARNSIAYRILKTVRVDGLSEQTGNEKWISAFKPTKRP